MDWLRDGWEWIVEREVFFTWLGGLSLATLVLSFFAVPILIGRMPADYFLEKSEEAEEIRRHHPVLRLFFLVVKNSLGGVLLIGGIIMLVTPGQGVLTILIALMLMNFPGKRTLEIRLVSIVPLNRAINWIRKRGGHEPLQLP